MANPRDFAPALVALVVSMAAGNATHAAGATPIEIDEIAFGSLDVAGERDEYTFEAAVGDVIWIRMAAEGSLLEPRMMLMAPGGGLVANGTAGVTISDIGDQPLTESGSYTLEAYDSNDNESGAYSLQVVRIGDGPLIDFGPPGVGALDARSDRNVFTFDATAGDLLWSRIAALSSLHPSTRIYGPDHAFLVSGTTGNSISDIVDYVAPATGTYSLVVYTNTVSISDYTYHLLRISDPVDAVPIEYGPVYADSIASFGEIDPFTFEAAAGDVIWIRMAQRSSVDPTLRLYDPSGTFISTGTNGVTISDIINLTLPATGTYTLLAYDGGSNTTGDYELELLRVSDPVDAIDTEFGPILCDDFQGNTQRIAYRLDGVAGDVVWMRITSAGSSQPRIWLYAPDFTVAATSTTNNTGGNILDFVLPSTGLYTVVAYSNNQNASDFCVHFVRISNPSDDVATSYGPVNAGNLDGLSDIDVYTFDADAGDVAWIRMTGQGSSIEPRMRLYGPSHTLVASGSANVTVSDILDFTMPATGTYTLLAYDANSNESDPYTVHLLRENDPVDAVGLVLGSETCASLADGGIDAYTFPALAGDSVRARMTEESSALEPTLRLLDPDGVVIIGGSGNPEVEIFAADLPADGVYKLLAYDDKCDDPGDYRVEVELCVDEPCGGVCPGDVTNDREVGFADLLIVLASWGSCECCPGDIDGSGAVEFADLLLILASWGPCL